MTRSPLSSLIDVPARHAIGLCRPWIEKTTAELTSQGDGHDEDMAAPAGELSLVPPDSVSWQVFKNPVSLLIGGIAAVVLELAEPRIRTGVHEHSNFKIDPVSRLRRTGRATLFTVYGAQSRARAMIARINAIHRPLAGTTPLGQPYAATDPDLLRWVHATASYGFMQARHVYVEPIGHDDQVRFYREGQLSARLYGAIDAPASPLECEAMLDARMMMLEPSPLVFEFLGIMRAVPLVPAWLRPLQGVLVRAAVQLLPPWARARLGLQADWHLPTWQAALLRRVARDLDRLPLRTGAPVQACRRLGLADDYLYRGR